MTAVVHLEADGLHVEPGQSATSQLSLSNTSSIVEQYTIMILGAAAEWTRSDPPVVSLFPGGQQSVTLRFEPPRLHTTPSGVIPFAVKVIPSNTPEESVTEEGEITVGSFTDVGAELLPRVTTGRVAGRQRLAVDSRGNVPIPVSIAAVDAAEALKFRISPQKLTTAPGEAHFVRMHVRPRQRFWKGPPQHKPYQVQVAPEGEAPVVLDGSLNQKAVLPRWVPLVAGLAALAVLFWFLVLRPVVHNIAVSASKPALAAQAAQTKALQGQVSAAQNQAGAANSAAKNAQSAAAAAAAAAGKKPPPTTTVPKTTTTVAKVVAAAPKTVPTTTVAGTTPVTQPPPVTGPNDGRIEVVVPPGSSGSNSFTIPAQSTLQVTDLVIQNVSGGQLGRARIERLAPTPGATPVPLLVENLGSLTDQEYRFGTPMVFTSGQQMVLSVDCQPNQPACDIGVYYTGPLTEPSSDTTTTFP
jgi:hypothetical protein